MLSLANALPESSTATRCEWALAAARVVLHVPLDANSQSMGSWPACNQSIDYIATAETLAADLPENDPEAFRLRAVLFTWKASLEYFDVTPSVGDRTTQCGSLEKAVALFESSEGSINQYISQSTTGQSTGRSIGQSIAKTDVYSCLETLCAISEATLNGALQMRILSLMTSLHSRFVQNSGSGGAVAGASGTGKSKGKSAASNVTKNVSTEELMIVLERAVLLVRSAAAKEV